MNNKKQQCCSLQSVPVCLLVPSRTPEMHMDCSPADKKINQIMVSIGSLVLLPASCNGSKESDLPALNVTNRKFDSPPKINPMDLRYMIWIIGNSNLTTLTADNWFIATSLRDIQV